MNTNEHQPTPEEIEVYNAAIMEGLQNRVILVTDEASIAAKIGTIRPLGEDGKIPREVIFDMQKHGPEGFNPLIRERSMVRPFRAKYTISRQDFYKNLGDTLTAVPRNLVRPTMLLMRDIFARLLRCGDILPRGYGGLAFFAVDKFGATGNLHHNTFLTRDAVDAGIDEMAMRGVEADTLIVPPALYGAAVQAVEMRNHVVNKEGSAEVKRSEPSRIKQIITLPELDNGAVAATRTWYLASCLGPNGPRALYGAVEEGFEFLTTLGQPNPTNDFVWVAERHAAFEYGDATYINRYDQGEPSAPHSGDIDWLNKITTYPGPLFEDAAVFDKQDSGDAVTISHTGSLTELIAKVASLTGLDADKIAARVEQGRGVNEIASLKSALAAVQDAYTQASLELMAMQRVQRVERDETPTTSQPDSDETRWGQLEVD